MLAKKILLRQPMTMKRLPFLARFYCRSYHCPESKWRSRVLRVLFPMFHALCRSSRGEFEYQRLGQSRTISFNARNLQFQSLYAPFFKHGFEPDVALLIDALLPEGGVFFDIGSNWGYFSLYAASIRERVTVHAFEPLPSTSRDLTHSVEQAGIKETVTCHPFALSNANAEAFIQRPDGLHSGQAMVSTSGGEARVATKRLDDLNLPRPDFIKMDVEGHELEVLQGATETLKQQRPFLVFENKPFGSASEKTLEPLLLLTELGYRLYVPAIQRKDTMPRFLPAGGCAMREGDCLALLPLEPKARLLWTEDLNVFACHESRLSQLAAVFRD